MISVLAEWNLGVHAAAWLHCFLFQLYANWCFCLPHANTWATVWFMFDFRLCICLQVTLINIPSILTRFPTSTCSVDQILTDLLLLIDMAYLHNTDIDVLALLLVLMIIVTNICLLYTWMYCLLVPSFIKWNCSIAPI